MSGRRDDARGVEVRLVRSAEERRVLCPVVNELDEAIFGPIDRQLRFQENAGRQDVVLAVAEVAGTLVGACYGEPDRTVWELSPEEIRTSTATSAELAKWAGNPNFHVSLLVVDAGMRRLGIARALLDQVIESVSEPQATLHADIDVEPAIRLYERRGWRRVLTRDDDRYLLYLLDQTRVGDDAPEDDGDLSPEASVRPNIERHRTSSGRLRPRPFRSR